MPGASAATAGSGSARQRSAARIALMEASDAPGRLLPQVDASVAGQGEAIRRDGRGEDGERPPSGHDGRCREPVGAVTKRLRPTH
jgi:hypothetical protein